MNQNRFDEINRQKIEIRKSAKRRSINVKSKEKEDKDMTNIKSYTDIEQSKKLAEILPVESADMYYIPSAEDEYGETLYTAEYKSEIIAHNESECIPCWSLAALLDFIPEGIVEHYYAPNIQKENGKYTIAYGDEKLLCVADTPVDACYEMIIKLHDWLKSFTHQKTTETKGGEIYE